MKITKAQLRKLIKEALEDRIDPDDDDLEQAGFRPVPDEMGSDELKQSYNFKIYEPGHFREDPDKIIMYVENVPLSALTTEDYEKYKAEGYKKPERFLKIKKEFLSELGFQANKYGNFKVSSYVIDQVPETIGVNVPFNLRTGEFMTDQVNLDRIPKVVDAQD